MSHLQSIERACQKANPKLLRLEYWCRIEFVQPSKYEKYPEEFYKKNACKEEEYIWAGVWTIEYRDHSSRNDTYYHKIGKWQGGYHSYESIQTTHIETMVKDGKCVILWHPITLQDILLVLAKSPIQPKYLHWYNDNDFLICLPFTEERKLNCVYDLTKSPYDQSEEVLQFLAENLTK